MNQNWSDSTLHVHIINIQYWWKNIEKDRCQIFKRALHGSIPNSNAISALHKPKITTVGGIWDSAIKTSIKFLNQGRSPQYISFCYIAGTVTNF